MGDATTEVLRAAAVFLGGGIGSLARYGLGRWLAVESFPWHTFAINVVGSFALGVFVASLKERPAALLLLGTGVCGGFTTFSTFSVETLVLFQKGDSFSAIGYSLGSVAIGLLAAFVALRTLE